jgi:tetratricopeptide (TPR) repeat protein
MELYSQWISDNVPSIIATAIMALLASILITAHRKINKKDKIINKCGKLFNNGLYKKTIKYCESIIEKDEDPLLYYYLGLAYSKIDEIDLAIKNLKKAEELSNGLKSYFRLNTVSGPTFYEDYADILRTAKKFDEAILYYKKALKGYEENSYTLNENTTTLLQKIAEIFEEKRNLEEAIDYYEESLIYLNISKRSPTYKNLIRKIAHLYEKKGDTKMANKIKKEIEEEIIIEGREERKEEPISTAANNPII